MDQAGYFEQTILILKNRLNTIKEQLNQVSNEYIGLDKRTKEAIQRKNLMNNYYGRIQVLHENISDIKKQHKEQLQKDEDKEKYLKNAQLNLNDEQKQKQEDEEYLKKEQQKIDCSNDEEIVLIKNIQDEIYSLKKSYLQGIFEKAQWTIIDKKSEICQIKLILKDNSTYLDKEFISKNFTELMVAKFKQADFQIDNQDIKIISITKGSWEIYIEIAVQILELIRMLIKLGVSITSLQ